VVVEEEEEEEEEEGVTTRENVIAGVKASVCVREREVGNGGGVGGVLTYLSPPTPPAPAPTALLRWKRCLRQEKKISTFWIRCPWARPREAPKRILSATRKSFDRALLPLWFLFRALRSRNRVDGRC
jgi:hypothetical protein